MASLHRTVTSSVDSSFLSSLPEDELLLVTREVFEDAMKHALKDTKINTETENAGETIEKISLGDTPSIEEDHAGSESTPQLEKNQMLTENGDVTFATTESPLLDLFIELERDIDGPHLEPLLNAAWNVNPTATLKIVWSARSIHLGKAEQDCFYKCLGWFRKNHPVTLLLNLQWLVRSIIDLKPANPKDDMELVDKEDLVSDGLDILHGGSHGYYKDLLNILVLAANGSLHVNDNPRAVLHKPNPFTKKRRCPYPPITDEKRKKTEDNTPLRTKQEGIQLAKQDKHKQETEYWRRAEQNLKDPFYRFLHLTVARIFADQLKLDLERLKSAEEGQLSKITLAAKWAPSLEKFHDKHTLIATSIAEILFPVSFFEAATDRITYLKLAREAYRSKYLTPLRGRLDVVERKVTAELFGDIDYSRVPSLAMDSYKNLFIRKDYDHFAKYITEVAEGKAKISGAVLTPATIIHEVMKSISQNPNRRATTAKELLAQKSGEILAKTSEAQWKTLVQRVRDSGKLSSTMAIVDVSGSMYFPTFHDGTTPVETAIGLGLLVSEVAPHHTGDRIVTFSNKPKVLRLSRLNPLGFRVAEVMRADWGMNTDFVAVFENILLPMVISRPSDGVKQLIVFSDMQFDAANAVQDKTKRWDSSYERIKKKYAAYKLQMPLLIFWNLAGHQGDRVPPKPVVNGENGTIIISGYSQGLLKMFLDQGGFDTTQEAEDEEMEEVVVAEDGDVVTKKVKKTVDPESGMWKAIGHKAYEVLKVYD